MAQLRHSTLTLNQEIGHCVAKSRNLARLTQAQLAERAKCSTEFISRIERGVSAASVKRLNAIATALEVPLKSLFDFDGESKKKEEIVEIIIRKKNESRKLIEEKYELNPLIQ